MIDNIYALKDVVHSDPFSKTNNFIYEWIKWFPYIKLAPKEYQFKNTDIIIVNLSINSGTSSLHLSQGT